MIYDVRQVTTYDYGSVVPFSRHVARLTPVDRPGQHVFAASLAIEPEPAEIAQSDDFFGNRVTAFALDHPHDRLTVALTARIAVMPSVPPAAEATPPWEALRDDAAGDTEPGPESPVHALYPSRAIRLTDAITLYAARSFPPGRPVLAGALDLNTRIKADLRYEPGSTDATTSPAAAFAARRGVCQDFAQVMIAGLRGLGLPARYVSGYLRTEPPPGRPRLEGADATHAWVEVWCGPQEGWVGLDPTNAMLAGEDHLVLAVGRDYADVSPLDGVIIASGGHSLEVKVDVVPILPVREVRSLAADRAARPSDAEPAGEETPAVERAGAAEPAAVALDPAPAGAVQRPDPAPDGTGDPSTRP